ncbi:MAG: hypothetical protein QNJ40_00795 [Xanthomonadales bacterium]|nr:hypothetical protein [Xanthomonadales bacterium]
MTPARPLLLSGLDCDHLTRAWIASAMLMLVLLLVLAPASLADPRTLDGVNVWAKPLKFAVSLFLHFLTLAILAQQLPRRVRSGAVLSVFGYLAVMAMLFEQGYISFKAGQARRSHFNYETELETLMYGLMGIGAILLILAAFVLGLLIWWKGSDTGPGLRWGTISGLLLSPVATFAVAAYLSAQGSHLVGPASAPGNGLPVVGWSREAGDLRVAHFFATHLMQTLPLVGLLGDRLNWRPRALVVLAAVIQLALIGWLFTMALAGRPLLPG